MKDKIHFRFEDLNVYSKAIDFGELVYLQVKTFPKNELYMLTSQFSRASDSIALNIAEGSGTTDANFMRYLGMARDSAHGCFAVSPKARLRNYINEEEDFKNRKALEEICKMLSSLIRHLSSKK